MTKKPDAEPKAAIKPPYEVSKEDILIANGLLSEICGIAVQCSEQWREGIWTRAAVVAEVLRQLRKNAEWAEQQGDASK
jgi:hypothetical protein